MQVTEVFVDKLEYCRYYTDLSTITATVKVDTTTGGDTITVDLVRMDGYGTVATKTITTTDGVTKYQVQFNLNIDPFSAPAQANAYVAPYYLAKAGDYNIAANGTSSSKFAVSIVPLNEIKTQWAKGVTFFDYEVLLPRVQPQQVTGVTITEVTLTHYKGVFPLIFTYSAGGSTLSWAGGAPVQILGDEPQSLLLLDQRQGDYIMVQVVPDQLPTQTVTESIVIDNGRMDDWAMIEQVRRATEYVEMYIISKVEPTLVDTDPNGAYCDEVAIPQTYIRPTTFNKWMSFKLPYPNVLDATYIKGYFNTDQVAMVPRQWYSWDEKTGIFELIPSTSSQVIWTFYNGIFVLAYLFNYASIPGFWHYQLWCGLRDLNGERAIVREAIAKKAVIELLNSAGTAYRAGYASQSESRDGVSSSQSYTSSAMYGTFGAHLNMYQEWLNKNLPKIKKRVTGIQYITI